MKVYALETRLYISIEHNKYLQSQKRMLILIVAIVLVLKDISGEDKSTGRCLVVGTYNFIMCACDEFAGSSQRKVLCSSMKIWVPQKA